MPTLTRRQPPRVLSSSRHVCHVWQAPAPDGGKWEHITSQIGMFAYTGLSAENVDALRADHHIYLTRDGRMSMAAMKPADVEYVASAIRNVLTS